MTSLKPSENPASTFEALSAFAGRDQLEPPETYREALEAVVEVLPQPGSLLHLPDLPTLIIPDLHARREMLLAVLKMHIAEGSLAGEQVFALLERGHINVVCLGDIVHSEERSHWVINLDGEWTQELLEKEIVRSLGAGAMIMYLKLQFPEHFHCLRGNHDDITEEFGSYRKFVGVRRDEQDELVFVDGRPVLTGDKGEPEIVREWVLAREGWGQDFLDAWAQFERALPLLAQGAYYVMSHTLPSIPISEAALGDPDKRREISLELTSNRKINREAIECTLDSLGLKNRVQRWFYGHTPVPPEKNGGKYEEDLDGLVIRLNNRKQYVLAYVPQSGDERRFVPTKDVYIKSPEEEHFHI
ncbi:MAG TPA: metallophosphoesterase [Ktedonobacteraceae bacterium]|nr:metallophosphoesterase [Ktedonobacteraceae bacterium]